MKIKLCATIYFVIVTLINYNNLYSNELISYLTENISVNSDSVLTLIKKGENINEVSIQYKNYGFTPLMIAVNNNDTNIVKLLLKNGANINKKIEYESMRDKEITISVSATTEEELSKKLETTPESPLYSGKDALGLAALKGYSSIVNILLKYGAQINTKDDNSFTPLHTAAFFGFYDIVKLLIENGAEVDCKEKWDSTPLNLACNAKNSNIDIIKLLIKNGANVNNKSKNGSTPLMGISRTGNNDIAKLLIENGATIDTKNNEGKTIKLEGNNTTTVTDIDGNVYKTVKIGNLWWMTENLKVTHYRNGDPIPNVTSDSKWSNLSTGAYCNYGNNEDNVATYGRLYNWHAVNDSRNIAPAGWHVPTDKEWKQLERDLGMSRSETNDTGYRGTNEGSKLAGNAILWEDGILGEEDRSLKKHTAFGESGLSLRPGGYRGLNLDGRYYDMGHNASFWTSTKGRKNNVWSRHLSNYRSGVVRDSKPKWRGFSIRCVRD